MIGARRADRERRDPEADRALTELRSHPIAAEAGRLAFEGRQAERKFLAEEADRIRVEGEAELDRLRGEVNEARHDLERARAAIASAVARETDARSAMLAHSVRMSQAVERRSNLIAVLAEPEIVDARERLRELSAVRIADDSVTIVVGRNPITGRRQLAETSKARSAAAQREAIRAGLALLDAMSREPDQSGVAERIEHIFAAIPEIRAETQTYERFAPPQSKKSRDVVDGAVIAFGGAN